MEPIVVIDEEFKSLIRPLSENEYRDLEESILKEGCRDALVLWGNTLVDGHHRHEICKKHSIPFKTVDGKFDTRSDVKIWIIKNQFGRRNLSAYDRSLLALKLEEFFREKAKENQEATQLVGRGIQQKDTMVCQNSDKPIEPVDTKKELAKIAGVSHDTIAKVKVIEKKATPEQKEKLEKREASINEIYTEIKEKESQEEGDGWGAACSYTPEPLKNRLVICPCGCGYGYHIIDEKWFSPTEYEGKCA